MLAMKRMKRRAYIMSRLRRKGEGCILIYGVYDASLHTIAVKL